MRHRVHWNCRVVYEHRWSEDVEKAPAEDAVSQCPRCGCLAYVSYSQPCDPNPPGAARRSPNKKDGQWIYLDEVVAIAVHAGVDHALLTSAHYHNATTRRVFEGLLMYWRPHVTALVDVIKAKNVVDTLKNFS